MSPFCVSPKETHGMETLKMSLKERERLGVFGRVKQRELSGGARSRRRSRRHAAPRTRLARRPPRHPGRLARTREPNLLGNPLPIIPGVVVSIPQPRPTPRPSRDPARRPPFAAIEYKRTNPGDISNGDKQGSFL